MTNTEREIEAYLRECLEPDGSNVGEVIDDAIIELNELGVTKEQVEAVYKKMTRIT